jgi:hypothetical protein
MTQFGGAEFAEKVKTHPHLGNLPELYEAFASVGTQMADRGVPITADPGNFNMTPGEIDSRISTLMNHEDRGKPGNEWIMNELTELYVRKHPEPKVANG